MGFHEIQPKNEVPPGVHGFNQNKNGSASLDSIGFNKKQRKCCPWGPMDSTKNTEVRPQGSDGFSKKTEVRPPRFHWIQQKNGKAAHGCGAPGFRWNQKKNGSAPLWVPLDSTKQKRSAAHGFYEIQQKNGSAASGCHRIQPQTLRCGPWVPVAATKKNGSAVP